MRLTVKPFYDTISSINIDLKEHFRIMNNFVLNPPTGEKPLSGWIIAIIIIAALAVVASLLLPKLPKIKKFFEEKFKK